MNSDKNFFESKFKAVKVIGVLLIFYEKYALESIDRFVPFLASISKNNTLVIVQNGEFKLPVVNHPNLHILKGDNSVREFSGWQAAISYCSENGLDTNQGAFIFANDTFCHHNKFGPLTRHLFSRQFRNVLRHPSSLTLAGETHGNNAQYSMLGMPFSNWVSTYLFCITFALSRKIGGVLPQELQLDAFFSGQANVENFLVGPLSANLIKDTNNWVFGLRPTAKWYGATQLSAENLPAFIGKTKSILCEKFLSAITLNVGGRVQSAFSSSWLNQVRRLERLLPK